MWDNEIVAENQSLKEVVEVAKQITSELDIKQITKNITYFVRSKFNTWCSFIIPEDFDDDKPTELFYEGSKLKKEPLGFDSLLPLVDFFNSHEYNQIFFTQFADEFEDKQIVQMLGERNPEFLLPLKSESGILGIYVQGKKRDGNSFSTDEIQFLVNVVGFGAISLENANLYRRATTDRMTKLFNHHQFQKTLEEYIQKASEEQIEPFALVMFDIDHFKLFNDNYGHLQGDIVIKEIAHIILGTVRECDYPARYGGEEFAIILPETSLDAGCAFSQRLRKTIEKHIFPGENRTFHATVSIGVAVYDPEHIKCNEDIIGCADKALYVSKQKGRNKVTRFVFKK